MSRPSFSLSAVPGVLLFVCVGQAPAQTIYPRASPVPAISPGYSPYLNLTRPGSLSSNYYGLVRPEIEARSAYVGLQQQVNGLRQQLASEAQPATGLPATGYPVRFLDYSAYFPCKAPQGSNRAGSPVLPAVGRR